MSGFHDNVLLGASGSQGYQISRSVRLRSSASAYLNRTFTSVGTRTKFTYSAWLKRGALGSFSRFLSDSTNNSYLRFNTSNALDWNFHNGTSSFTIITSQVFRDPSAWYHVIVAVDTTQATNTNRVKIYVNGSQVTAFSSSAYPNQNDVSGFNNNTAHYISGYSATAEFLDGYITEVNFIDGQALDPSSFGETNPVTGVWQPKKYTGTYGTNGFYLNFSDNSAATAATIGKDNSGNGNNWTPNNISVTAGVTYDSMLDVPTQWADGGNGRGNYAVINPLNNSGGATISDGNLKALWASASDRSVLSTFPIPSSGKFYAEFVVGTLTSASVAASFGLATEGSSRTAMAAANMWVYYGSNQSNIVRSGTFSSQIGTNQTLAAGGILQVAIDRDNNQAWLGYNDVWINSTNGTTGNPSAGTNPTVTSLPADLFILVGMYANNGNVNFGQRPFSYTPPTGFKALNTLNLPTPTILKGNQYFDATTYTGNGSARSITGTPFQPDLVWIKGRSGATDHALYDAVRGVQLDLVSNSTAAETTQSTGLTAFNSDGFSIGTLAKLNTNTATYVGWQWKEGATQGFDIVTYTGNGANRTIAHALGVAPSMIIVKRRDSTGNWPVQHASVAAANTLYLNLTNASAAAATVWNSTAATSTVFSVGTSTDTNANTGTYVAYLFAQIAGFSAFGSYTGNGSTDGPFVFCGFRPRFVMYKRTDAADGWVMLDSARDTFNLSVYRVLANSSAAESSSVGFNNLDLLSNGFKIRSSSTDQNANGGTYIFAAFAEHPFKNALAR